MIIYNLTESCLPEFAVLVRKKPHHIAASILSCSGWKDISRRQTSWLNIIANSQWRQSGLKTGGAHTK